MPEELAGCLLAREALTRCEEISVDVRALDRRVETSTRDRVRLGERVSELGERLTEHESASDENVKELYANLHNLNATVSDLNRTVKAAIAMPPVPSGLALAESWRATPPVAKFKITAAIIGLLSAPEVIKALGEFVVYVAAHFFAGK